MVIGEGISFNPDSYFQIEGPLWENASPTSSFAAQTISCDLSGYDFFGVVLRFAAGTADNAMMQIFTVDETRKTLVIIANNANRTGGRHVTWSASAKTLTFDGAYYNGAANNANAIPVYIYGIKGVKAV